MCPTEIHGFSSRVAEFDALGAKVIGCSVDSKFSHLAWTERDLGKLGFPLLSDMKREVVDAYGVLQALQTGELCPLDWQPGEATLG